MSLSKFPLVSVVMPNYNNKKYLAEAIESILLQTYKNIELIIVDGHSTDGSIDIIQSYMKKDNRIRLIYDNGGGVGAATIIGCDESKGDYIARMDSDDISNTDRIEIEVKFLMNNPDYVLVSSAKEFIDENGHVIGRDFPITDDKIIRKFLERNNPINQPMAMFRKDTYIQSGGYVPLIYVEDRVFWCRLSKYGKIKNFSTPLGKYRLLGDSLCHTYNPYDKVLFELRNKMVADQNIMESDVDLYNSICEYSKKFRKAVVVDNESSQISKQFRLYTFLRKIIGEHYAETLICMLNNYRYKKII